jgi:hypothetical protein
MWCCASVISGVVVAGCAAANTSSSGGRGAPVVAHYNTEAARREATVLLGLVRLPGRAMGSASEPAGAGTALVGDSVNVPVVPSLVDLHAFFVVPAATVVDVIDAVQGARPAGAVQGDSGSGGTSGEQWTSFDFPRVRGFAFPPELVVNAVPVAGAQVAVRVDAQVAPRPELPASGRRAGALRIVEEGTMLGTFGYTLRCGPPGGTAPDPALVCAAIAADSALLYSVAGPDHSCPPTPTIALVGRWGGKRVHSTFSVCIGGQEPSASRWMALLPTQASLGALSIDRGVGLIRLGEPERPVLDLLRGAQPAPASCTACTRTFSSGASIGYGARRPQRAALSVRFEHSAVDQIATDYALTADRVYLARGFTSVRRALHGWTVRDCGIAREIVHRSASGTTAVIYGRGDDAFATEIVSSVPIPCQAA